ncbi:putative transposase (plasmid) [Rhodococcus erythropolis PR4]|uniref:Putative transposase n=1 Tax=Rhodococcus erythropolis (strain PR4 / NBRC 100887) TaxID=234621 RepID=Q3L9I1_RHOE4|nr:putative transposase [Rhodococcus erythropolis PR4]
MAIWRCTNAGADLSGLIHHSDRGVQYRAIRYTDRLAEADAVASVGSRGDSYDNALAGAYNSLFKAELIRNKGPLAYHHRRRDRGRRIRRLVQRAQVAWRAGSGPTR